MVYHGPSWWSMCISTSKSHWMEETRKCVYSGGKGSEVSGKKGWVLMVGELICPSPWRSVTSLKGKPVRCMGHRAGNLISSETRKQLHHWLTVHWKSQKWERYVAGFCSTPWGCKKYQFLDWLPGEFRINYAKSLPSGNQVVILPMACGSKVEFYWSLQRWIIAVLF